MRPLNVRSFTNDLSAQMNANRIVTRVFCGRATYGCLQVNTGSTVNTIINAVIKSIYHFLIPTIRKEYNPLLNPRLLDIPFYMPFPTAANRAVMGSCIFLYTGYFIKFVLSVGWLVWIEHFRLGKIVCKFITLFKFYRVKQNALCTILYTYVYKNKL